MEPFVARRPRPGQYLVSIVEERVCGRVVSVRRRDRRVSCERLNGQRFITWTDWEDLQYHPARYRFVDQIPQGFTSAGKPRAIEPCADCGRPSTMTFHTYSKRKGWETVPVCSQHWQTRERARLREFYAKHGGAK